MGGTAMDSWGDWAGIRRVLLETHQRSRRPGQPPASTQAGCRGRRHEPGATRDVEDLDSGPTLGHDQVVSEYRQIGGRTDRSANSHLDGGGRRADIDCSDTFLIDEEHAGPYRGDAAGLAQCLEKRHRDRVQPIRHIERKQTPQLAHIRGVPRGGPRNSDSLLRWIP